MPSEASRCISAIICNQAISNSSTTANPQISTLYLGGSPDKTLKNPRPPQPPQMIANLVSLLHPLNLRTQIRRRARGRRSRAPPDARTQRRRRRGEHRRARAGLQEARCAPPQRRRTHGDHQSWRGHQLHTGKWISSGTWKWTSIAEGELERGGSLWKTRWCQGRGGGERCDEMSKDHIPVGLHGIGLGADGCGNTEQASRERKRWCAAWFWPRTLVRLWYMLFYATWCPSLFSLACAHLHCRIRWSLADRFVARCVASWWTAASTVDMSAASSQRGVQLTHLNI